MFAIDFMGVAIKLAGAPIPVRWYWGYPVGNADKGFSLDPPVPNFGPLPDPLPISCPVGATGTGFDETISSIAFEKVVPEPSALALMACCAAPFSLRRR